MEQLEHKLASLSPAHRQLLELWLRQGQVAANQPARPTLNPPRPLAARAPLPVEIDSVPAERLPQQIEAAAFYVVSESLTNVAKYAQASYARVSVTCEDGHALIEVVDDGVGGADAGKGSGLRGLADRVEALDGVFAIESPTGAGTCVRAAIPLSAGVRLPAPQASG